VSWRVEVKRSAEKELARLSGQARERIVKALRAMIDDPFPPGFKKLKGSDGYRIRVGQYRVLYRVDSAAHFVWVGAIGHRKDVYR
jgi:mRNA interferase RelE/StbE